MTPLTTALAARAAIAAAITIGALILPHSEAGAVSLRVKMACAGDYYSDCSQYAPESAGVRQCMRANGPKLSQGCVSALVAAGEVSKSETSQRSASAN